MGNCEWSGIWGSSRKSRNQIHIGLPEYGHFSKYDTLPLIQQGLKMNGETQIIANGEMTVYSSDFFQPYDYASGELHTTKNTFSIHHFDGGWLGEAETKGRAKTQLRYKEFLSRLEG